MLGCLRKSHLLYLLVLSLAVSPLSADAASVTEIEANNSRATATPIPDASFDFAPVTTLAFRNATNDPAAPRFPAAALFGTNSTLSDVDYFSFAGTAGEMIYVDTDNDPAVLCQNPCNFDGALVLLSSTGVILAAGDNQSQGDLGSPLLFDPFIGVFTLPTTDTYFLAVSSGPLAANIDLGATLTPLTRPDGSSGGFAVSGSPGPGEVGGGQSSGGYLVLVSRSGPTASVPEPGTFALIGVALVALSMTRRRKKA